MSNFPASKIRNVIFDLGGVLLNINPLLSLQELDVISGLGQEALVQSLADARVFEKFDTGSLSPAQFRSELCRILNKPVSDEEIDRIWNLLLLDFPSHRVQMLRELRKNYRIFLLSNTNIIHYQHYTKVFYENYGFQMNSLFDRLFLSYEIGIHKPDAGIYQYVLENAELEPSECIFIDDSLANIEAAAIQGITGIHIQNGHDVNGHFDAGILRNL